MPWKSSRFCEEHRRLHELVEARAGFGEDRCEVREDLFGLLLDRAAGELLVAGLQRELARDEYEVARVRIACEYGAP